MEHRFVHVGFHFAKTVKMTELEPVFTAIGSDWLRLSSLSWILWTNKPTPHIFTLLAPHLDTQGGDQVIIAPLDMSQGFGFLSPWIWNWFENKTPGSAFSRGPDALALMRLPESAFKQLTNK